MKKILRFLKNYKMECVMAPLFKMLEASFELFIPLVIAAIIDQGILRDNRPFVVQRFFVLLLLAVIGLTCAVTAQFFAAKAAVGFATRLRHSLFEHIQTLSFSEMDTIGTSTLITRMTSDINQVQSCVNMVLRLFLRSPFIVFGAMIMAFTVDVKGALVFVVTIPLLSIVVFTIMVITIPMFARVQKALDLVLTHTRENLSGVRVIRAFRKEKEETETFFRDNDILTRYQLAVGRVSALTNPLTLIVVDCSIVALVWLGAKEVYAGSISQGEVVALVSYMSQILVELVKLANLIVNITKSVACGNRIQAVFETEASIVSGTVCKDKESENSVVFDHVSMTYAGAKEEALTDIHFAAKKGQTIGVIGGTGSGKSSLVHLIPRFYDVSAGAVYVNGIDVREYDLEVLRSKIGMVMQKAVLFAGTIRENMKWGNQSATDEEIWNALRLAQAEDVVKGKEGELDFVIEQEGRNLSGGQRQRLTIARALVKNPDILILDDSASALDYATDAKLREALRTLSKEKTIFIVSQRTSSIRYADLILVMDDGVVTHQGTHDSLLENCEIYREIYESQFKKGGKSNEE
ncbi:MAG: ABC transporter ATP-binding protein/permease [Agathobacter sp.]|nr:ABC transporter ATP-binding protein/permease [Agathobacter sp.]